MNRGQAQLAGGGLALWIELGIRVYKAVVAENTGLTKWRQTAIAGRWYDQFKATRS